MALARKCDRCGGFYNAEMPKANKGDFNALELINRNLTNDFYSIRVYDLCRDCRDSFIKWLNNDQKEA